MATILIVEDNMDLRENTAELLELSGHKVVVASNGIDGLKLAKAMKPDLILCDIVMPKAGGYQLLKSKRSTKKINNIPLVFLSAGSAPTSKNRDERPDAFLSKPFSYEQLLAVVGRFTG